MPEGLDPPIEESPGRLTIFWRIILAQIALMGLIVVVNLYALSQFNQLTSLSAAILTTDATYIHEVKRLLRIFLAQMRHAEKYVLLQDRAFYNHFLEGQQDFERALGMVATFMTSPQRVFNKVRCGPGEESSAGSASPGLGRH